MFSFCHQKVDFSSNQIMEMCDLSAYHTLTQLILDSILWMPEGEAVGTCSTGEGVTVSTEWYQISDCPEVCGSCNWIRTSSHKTWKEICLPRTRSTGQSLPWPSDPSKQRRAVLDMNVKLVLDYRPREVLLNEHVSSNLLKLLPNFFIQIQNLKNLDLS